MMFILKVRKNACTIFYKNRSNTDLATKSTHLVDKNGKLLVRPMHSMGLAMM